LEAITARRVCLIGAECTGKTRLAEDLARHFAAVCVPEYAREYAVRGAGR
jgi:nicotinamide riboside kinase